MLYINPIWKEISCREYKKITSGKSEMEIILNSNISKKLKPEVQYANIPKGIGIRETMKRVSNTPVEYTDEDYSYFKRTSKWEMVFIGGEESCAKFMEEWGKSIRSTINYNK